jgi:hypothetical protein
MRRLTISAGLSGLIVLAEDQGNCLDDWSNVSRSSRCARTTCEIPRWSWTDGVAVALGTCGQIRNSPWSSYITLRLVGEGLQTTPPRRLTAWMEVAVSSHIECPGADDHDESCFSIPPGPCGGVEACLLPLAYRIWNCASRGAHRLRALYLGVVGGAVGMLGPRVRGSCRSHLPPLAVVYACRHPGKPTRPTQCWNFVSSTCFGKIASIPASNDRRGGVGARCQHCRSTSTSI